MKVNKIKSVSLLFLTAIILLVSCSKDETKSVTGKIKFATADLIEVEGATIPLGINLSIDSYYHKGGTVHIDVTGGNYGSDYTLSSGSSSFEIQVNPGSLLASFSVTTINDNLVEGDVDLVFTITSVSGDLIIGNDSTFNLKILNDDIPSIATANFANPTYQINENDTSVKQIDLAFNQPTSNGGTISISTTGTAIFGTDFSIVGESSATFNIVVPPGASSAQFSIQSIDDAVFENNKEISFTITAVSGGLQFQSPNETTVTIVDNDFVQIPINYVQDFESNNSTPNYLSSVLGFNVLTINQSSNITTLMSLINSAGSFSDVNTVTATSNNGINLNYTAGSPATPGLLGDLDQVLISPIMHGNGNVTVSIDYSNAFTAQNNANVTFYWSQTYIGGAFNLSQWTQIGSDTAAGMVGEGYASNAFKRRTMGIIPTSDFYIAIRVNQNINATNYRTRWRFDNLKVTN